MLRPSVATAYAETTVPAHIAARITGHSKAVYEKHYAKTHQDQLELENALKRLLELRLRDRVSSPGVPQPHRSTGRPGHMNKKALRLRGLSSRSVPGSNR
jgi:hypothetical protein